jgi:hypothetical protein
MAFRRAIATRPRNFFKIPLLSALRFASFAPAHVALRAAFGRQCWFASSRDVSPFGLLMQPAAQPPCCLVPSQHPLACVPLPLCVTAPLREIPLLFPISRLPLLLCALCVLCGQIHRNISKNLLDLLLNESDISRVCCFRFKSLNPNTPSSAKPQPHGHHLRSLSTPRRSPLRALA